MLFVCVLVDPYWHRADRGYQTENVRKEQNAAEDSILSSRTSAKKRNEKRRGEKSRNESKKQNRAEQRRRKAMKTRNKLKETKNESK